MLAILAEALVTPSSTPGHPQSLSITGCLQESVQMHSCYRSGDEEALNPKDRHEVPSTNLSLRTEGNGHPDQLTS